MLMFDHLNVATCLFSGFLKRWTHCHLEKREGIPIIPYSRQSAGSRSPPLFIDWRRYIHYTVKNSYTHCQVHTEWVSEWVNELRYSVDALYPLTLFVWYSLTPYGLSVLLFCVWWREAALWTSFLLSPSRGSSIITLSALIYRGRGRVSCVGKPPLTVHCAVVAMHLPFVRVYRCR